MSAHGTEPNTEPLLFPDPVIEEYIKDVDRTLLRENLRLSSDARFARFSSLMRGIHELRRAGAQWSAAQCAAPSLDAGHRGD